MAASGCSGLAHCSPTCRDLCGFGAVDLLAVWRSSSTAQRNELTKFLLGQLDTLRLSILVEVIDV